MYSDLSAFSVTCLFTDRSELLQYYVNNQTEFPEAA